MEREKFVLEESVRHLDQLKEIDKPKWGKMSAQHMVEHLGAIFMIAAGRIQPKGLPESKQKDYYKLLMEDAFRFKPNTRSPVLPEDPLPLRFDEFESAKQALFKAMERFKQKFEEENSARTEHPVLGPLNYEEWLQFHEIHLKHHMNQFGLWENDPDQ